MLKKIIDVIDHIPVINLVPLATKIMVEFPTLWDKVPQEKKEALVLALVEAGTKAAATYAKGKAEF